MAVKIIINRKVPKEKEQALLPLLLELRALATVQRGYISGETLRNVQEPEEYVVISTWRSVEDWDAWAASQKRAEIQGRIDDLLGEKTEYGIYFYG
jgi:heme-degrading monooxygenase HmoA